MGQTPPKPPPPPAGLPEPFAGYFHTTSWRANDDRKQVETLLRLRTRAIKESDLSAAEALSDAIATIGARLTKSQIRIAAECAAWFEVAA